VVAKKSFFKKNKKAASPIETNTLNKAPVVSNIVEFRSVIKNINGVVFADAPVVVKVRVIKDSTKGKLVFEETHVVTTNQDGVVKLNLGQGIPVKGNIDSIHWKSETYFIKTETNPTGITKIDSAKNVIVIHPKGDSLHKNIAPHTNELPAQPKTIIAAKTTGDIKKDSLTENSKPIIVKKNWAEIKNKLLLQNETIEDHPDSANAYYIRGGIKNELQDYRGAISDFTKAIELDSVRADFYKAKGFAEMQLNNYRNAISDFDQVIKINPLAEVFAQRGIAKTYLTNVSGVLTDFDKAIELAPDSAEYYLYRGTYKSNIKNYKGAIADYSKSISKKPNNPVAFYNRGIAESYINNDIGAIEDFGQAIKLNPNNADAYYKRAISKTNLKDIRGAIADYEKTINLDTFYLKAYYNAGILKTELKDYKGAIYYFNRTIELKPDWSNAYFSRGVTKINLGQTDDGCLDLSKAGELGYSKAYDVIKEHCH